MMTRKPKNLQAKDKQSPIWLLATEGLVVGVVTGLVELAVVLIIPALVLLGGLSMRIAV